MKRVFFFAVLASVAFAGCTFDEGVSDGAVNGNEINFAVAQYTPQTRAEHDPDAAYTDDVCIWSWYYGSNASVINADVYNTNAFTGGNKYYWPVDGRALDFVAVPFSLVNSSYFTSPVRDDSGNTTLTFSITAGDNYHSTNLMTTEVITNKTSGTVALLFRHLLSKVKINVSQKERENTDARWLVTVNDIKVEGLKNAGNVAINNSWDATDGDKLWNTTSGSETWQVTDGDKSLYESINVGAATTPYASAATYYMLPQELVADTQKITISYTVETDYLGNPTQPNTTETYSKTFDLKGISGINAWYMNKNITYNISIDPSETLNPITFTVNEELWGEGEGGEDLP